MKVYAIVIDDPFEQAEYIESLWEDEADAEIEAKNIQPFRIGKVYVSARQVTEKVK